MGGDGSVSVFRSANRVLFLSGVAFVGAWLSKIVWPDLLLPRCAVAVTEAALIGGIADWFAVTALFRKPLGIPWHTALIPRNRLRLVRGLSSLTRDRLYNLEVLHALLEDWNPAPHWIAWIGRNKGVKALEKRLPALLQEWLDGLDIRPWAERLEAVILSPASRVDPARWLSEGTEHMLREGRDAVLWDSIAVLLRDKLDSPDAQRSLGNWAKAAYAQSLSRQGTLTRILGEVLAAMRHVDPEELAMAVAAELRLYLQEFLDNADHPLRPWLRARLLDAMEEIGSRPEVKVRLAQWRQQALGDLPLVLLLQAWLESLIRRDKGVPQQGQGASPLAEWALGQLSRGWRLFKQRADLQLAAAGLLKSFLRRILPQQHHRLGEIVEHAMGRLTDERLIRLVEAKAGEDLNWIRINGSLVGAMAGLLLFLFIHYIYNPYVQPLLANRLLS